MNHELRVRSVAFSPDGKYLATVTISDIFSSGTNTVRVWEATNGKEVTRLSHEDDVSSVAFSPDGKYLATASEDGTARVWLLWPEDLIAEAGSRLTRNLTYQEWQRYLPDEPYRKTCPNLPIHPSFIAAGIDLARAGDVDSAVTIFRRAIELEPRLDFEPEAVARNLAAAQELVAKGMNLARAKDIDGAVSIFRRAIELDPSLDLEPEEEAQRLAPRSDD